VLSSVQANGKIALEFAYHADLMPAKICANLTEIANLSRTQEQNNAMRRGVGIEKDMTHTHLSVGVRCVLSWCPLVESALRY